MVPPADESFEQFATFAIPRLRRTAYAYCQDWHHADDAVQSALERVCAAWPRVRPGEAYGYTRATLFRLLVSEGRRPWRRYEVSSDDPGRHENDLRPSQDGSSDPATGRVELLFLLSGLPKGQRAVVLLRYIEHLSVSETAEVLRCSHGTVKSQTHAARRSLKALLSDPLEEGAQR